MTDILNLDPATASIQDLLRASVIRELYRRELLNPPAADIPLAWPLNRRITEER